MEAKTLLTKLNRLKSVANPAIQECTRGKESEIVALTVAYLRETADRLDTMLIRRAERRVTGAASTPPKELIGSRELVKRVKEASAK